MANRARRRDDDDDFRIDFSKHSREMSAAMVAEERYWRENDAKFRAVNQKVGSYDEFKDIVAAAHLKPLEKGDRISDMKRFNQPWNIFAKSEADGAVPSTSGTSGTDFAVPSNILEFARDWKRQPDDERRMAYFSSIEVTNLRRIFKNDSGFGLIADIIVLLDQREQLDVEWTMEVLEILSHCDRFSLTLQFMSSAERETCEKLISRLSTEAAGETQTERVETLKRRFKVKT